MRLWDKLKDTTIECQATPPAHIDQIILDTAHRRVVYRRSPRLLRFAYPIAAAAAIVAVTGALVLRLIALHDAPPSSIATTAHTVLAGLKPVASSPGIPTDKAPTAIAPAGSVEKSQYAWVDAKLDDTMFAVDFEFDLLDAKLTDNDVAVSPQFNDFRDFQLDIPMLTRDPSEIWNDYPSSPRVNMNQSFPLENNADYAC